jgi:hypothetical protein
MRFANSRDVGFCYRICYFPETDFRDSIALVQVITFVAMAVTIRLKLPARLGLAGQAQIDPAKRAASI